MNRSTWAMVVVAAVGLALSTCYGCKTSGLDLDAFLEFLSEHREEIIELAEAIPTATPTPVATPTPAPVTAPVEGQTYHSPTFAASVPAVHPVGVVVTTGHDCSWYPVPRNNHYGSISCGRVSFLNEETGQMITYDPYTSPAYWEAVDGADNWSKGFGKVKDGVWVGGHYYTTAHVENDGGSNPTADGTRRGRAVIPFSQDGVWSVVIDIRATNNRGSALLGLTRAGTDGTVTDWYSWDQTGSGEYDGGYHSVTVATGVRFEAVSHE